MLDEANRIRTDHAIVLTGQGYVAIDIVMARVRRIDQQFVAEATCRVRPRIRLARFVATGGAIKRSSKCLFFGLGRLRPTGADLAL
jgi:hypothetical protein